VPLMTAGLPDLAVTPSTLALALVLSPGPRYKEAPRGRREGDPMATALVNSPVYAEVRQALTS